MPDSLMTQSGWKSSPFSRGSRWGSSSSRNTLARTSSAAAEHFPVGGGGGVRSCVGWKGAWQSQRLQVGRRTQVPVRQRVVVVLIILVDVLSLLAFAPLVLQGDGAGLVEAGLDVLLAVWDGLVLLHVSLEREVGGRRSIRNRTLPECERGGGQLTLSRMMSISEYFIPFTRMGISLVGHKQVRKSFST